MHHLLHTYWIECGEDLNTHFGVTAYSYEDALWLLQQTCFINEGVPKVNKYLEDITADQLDQEHTVPNMGPITERGVRYPNFFPFNKF